MGTKAVLRIKELGEETIIGMTSDGSETNLEYIADRLCDKAKKLRVLTQFRKCDKQTIQKVVEEVVKDHHDWLFTDNQKNAVWIRYSAEFSVKDKTFVHYEGLFEHQTATHIISF